VRLSYPSNSPLSNTPGDVVSLFCVCLLYSVVVVVAAVIVVAVVIVLVLVLVGVGVVGVAVAVLELAAIAVVAAAAAVVIMVQQFFDTEIVMSVVGVKPNFSLFFRHLLALLGQGTRASGPRGGLQDHLRGAQGRRA